MSEPKFTPGPWIADEPADGDIYRYVLNGNGRCGAYIAKLDLRKGDNPPDEQEANARLIAAAPDLLDALENMHEAMVDYEMDVVGECDVPNRHRDLMQKTRAAIAKARGKYG